MTIDLQAALTLATEAKARADKVTPTLKRIDNEENWWEDDEQECACCAVCRASIYLTDGEHSGMCHDCAHDVAMAAVAARTDVPALASLVEELVAALKHARLELEASRACYDNLVSNYEAGKARVRAETIASVLLITSNYRCEQEDCACVDCAVIRAAEAKIKRLEEK